MAACLSQNDKEEQTKSEPGSAQVTDIEEDAAPATPAPEHFIIRNGGVGHVRIGMPLNEIRNKVAPGLSISDTTLTMEGQASTAYNLRAQTHAKGILIEQRCEPSCQVWRIHVKSTNYKTSKGMGVGSKFSEIQQHYPIQSVTLADGVLIAVSKETGLSFILDSSQIPAERRSNLTPSTVPANTLVKGVLLY